MGIAHSSCLGFEARRAIAQCRMESMRKWISPWILAAVIAAPPVLILGMVGSLWWIAGHRLERVEAEKAAELTQEKLPEAITPLFADPLPDDA